MKKLLVLICGILLLLCACEETPEPVISESSGSEIEQEPKPEEPVASILPTNSFEIWRNEYYPEGGFVYEGEPQIYGDTVLFIENQQDYRGEGKKGNVYTYDITTGKVTPYNFYAYGAIHLYNGNIYYQDGGELLVYNIESNKSKILEHGIAEAETLQFSSFWNEFAILCHWNSGGEGVHSVYAHNLETGETSLIIESLKKELNPFTGRDFKIKSGYLTYVIKSDAGFEVHAIDLYTGESTHLKTLEKEPYNMKAVYNGKYLAWCDEDGIKVLENGEEYIISNATRGVELVNEKLIVCGTRDFGFYVYDLESRKKILDSAEEFYDLDIETWSMDFTGDDRFVLAAQEPNMYANEFFTKTLYPNWNWESQGQYADAPHSLVVVEIYQYPEDDAAVEDMFNFGEGVTAIKLEAERGHFHIDCILETEDYILYKDVNIHRICDKATGKILHTDNYSDFCTGTLFSWRTDLCTEKEGYDYRILFTDRVIYRSTSDFTKSETVMLTEFIPETSEYYAKQNMDYDINGENTFVIPVDGGIVMKKEGEEPKVILPQGYFPSEYDFYKVAKGVPKDTLEASKNPEYDRGPVYFNYPRFICGGTKIVVSAEDSEDYIHYGLVVYDIETEKIEYCLYSYFFDIFGSKYPIDDRYIRANGVIWNAETGKSQKYEHTGITVPNSNRNLLIREEGKQAYMSSPLFDFRGYVIDLETGEEREFISTKEKGYPECYAVTENYYIIRVHKETLEELEFYAVKFR